MEKAVNDPSITVDFPFLKNIPNFPLGFLPKDLALPDGMTFSCGGSQSTSDFKTTYEKNFFLDEMYFPSLPLSYFVNTESFHKYLENNRFVKCRILLYKKSILQYFSQDIKLIDTNEVFLRDINQLSEEDTLWNFNTLSRLFYWL